MSGLSIRLISSVAVVGRDNEPIYLRGDLCDVTAASFNLDTLIGDSDEECSEHDETSVQDADAISVQRDIEENSRGNDPSTVHSTEEEDSDPFGFFTENSHSMSLTNQLVLHASLDRFEEMARSSNGAVRWRMPGSNGANAMWMGRLCEVEERWNVYGYLTNTGIKFMIIVENVQINEDGILIDHTPTLFAHQSSHREADLKNMFTQLHELYVRYTMNPFSKLRSPIQSRAFDEGINEMAREFNAVAVKRASNEENDLSWM